MWYVLVCKGECEFVSICVCLSSLPARVLWDRAGAVYLQVKYKKRNSCEGSRAAP